jgi:hypothetical protein
LFHWLHKHFPAQLIDAMNQKLSRLLLLIKQDAGLYLGISLGIFLFVLFFQPFHSVKFDMNNWLLFVAGVAACVYFVLILVRILFRWIIADKEQIYDEPYIHSGFEEFIIWVLCSVAVSFYLRYVGSIPVTFYVIFKVVLICLIPPLVVRFYDRLKLLKQENATLLREKDILQQTVQHLETDSLNKSIEFVSDNLNENIVVQLSDIILVKSADNYIEIIYREGTDIKRHIIRSTLKSVETQLKPFSSFIRCHRTAIVNSTQIQRINTKFGSYSLSLTEYGEEVPVSRQYLYKIKNLK